MEDEIPSPQRPGEPDLKQLDLHSDGQTTSDINIRNEKIEIMNEKGSTDVQIGNVQCNRMDKTCEYATKFFTYNPKEHELEVEMGFLDPSNPPIPGCNLEYIMWRTRRFVEHFLIRLLTALIIFIDMILIIVDLTTPQNDPIEYCCLAFSVYFMIEIILRIFGLGPRVFFKFWYNSLDCFLVVFTFILSVLTIWIGNNYPKYGSLLIALRSIRLIRITRILWERKHLKAGARQFVSENKRRYQQDGFDLDLTYVTPRVIAMSFPSTGKMSIYRNDIKEVERFMNTKHPYHHRLYNLCSERHYETKNFHSVERFHIDDHNVPPLEDMLKFSANVKEWMENPQNVIAVHCKGGKGRTGTMICVFLIDTGAFRDAEHSLGYFGDRRTDKNVDEKFQGVETPSQSRYVGYYEQVVRAGRVLPIEVPLVITSITLHGMNSVGRGDGSELSFDLMSRSHSSVFHAQLKQKRNCKVTVDRTNGIVKIILMNAPEIKGDTRIMFYSDSRKIPRAYENSPFFFWFHTGFIKYNTLHLTRIELDNPHKSKSWSVFREDFGVTIDFERV